MVGIPHCTPGPSQRVLAHRPLAQLHTSQRSEHGGDLPYRNAHSIVEHVGRRHHSSPYPVRAGPVLVRRNIGMPPSDLLTARPAPTYLHPVPRHLGSGNRRNVGCVDNPHSLMLESASTSGAGVLSHRHLYKRLGDFIGRRRLSIADRPHTRLAAGTLGSAASPTLGERSRLALSSRVPGSGVRGRGSGERETTASSLAGKQQAREKEDNGGQGKDGPAGAIAQGGNGR